MNKTAATSIKASQKPLEIPSVDTEKIVHRSIINTKSVGADTESLNKKSNESVMNN